MNGVRVVLRIPIVTVDDLTHLDVDSVVLGHYFAITLLLTLRELRRLTKFIQVPLLQL